MSMIRLVVIALLMVVAVLFLAAGLDVPIPHLPWRGVAQRDLPLGILLVFASLAVARFWTIPQDEGKLVEQWQRTRKPHR